MTKQRNVAIVVGVMWLSASAALAWTPSECPEELAQGWAEHAERMEDAEPGSPIFTPKPYPKTKAEIVEDLRYGYLLLWSDNDFSGEPPAARLVFDGLKSGDLEFDVGRIQNWSLTRCQPTRRKGFYHLVRIYLPGGETEIARAAVNEDGLLGAWHFRPEDEELALRWSEILRSPERTRSEVTRKMGVQGGQPQWVQTSGTLRCSLFEPCVAIRGQGRAYIVDKLGDVYEVRDDGPRLSRQQATDPAARSALMETLHESGGTLMSIGADFAVIGRVGRVDPADPGPRNKN